MPRRRMRRRSFSRPNGKTFWLRPPAFTLATASAADGIFTAILLTEADFTDPNTDLNDTVKGAPILERVICDIGFDMVTAPGYFEPAGFNQTTMLVEALLFTQDDQFNNIITNNTNFDITLNNSRILGYQVMEWNMSDVTFNDASVQQQVRCRAHFEPKTKTRLREKSLACAIRTNMDTGNADVLSTFPWVQPTMLVRNP